MESPILRDGCWSVNPNKMCSLHDAVNMDDPFERCLIIVVIWLHDPHSCFLIRFVTNTRVPMDQCTWICGTTIGNWQEEPNASNVEAVHTFQQFIGYRKYTVISVRAIMPSGNSLDSLTLHPTNATEITGSMESCNDGSINMDLFMKSRKIGIWWWQLLVELVIQEFADE